MLYCVPMWRDIGGPLLSEGSVLVLCHICVFVSIRQISLSIFIEFKSDTYFNMVICG